MNGSRLIVRVALTVSCLPLIAFAVLEDETTSTLPEMPVGPSISSVTVTDITDTSARIDVNSDEVTQGYVEYGTTEQYGMSTPLTSEFSTSPSFLLENLAPETLYHYRVIVMDSAGNAAITGDETFTTLATPEPEPETPPPSNTSTETTTATTTSPAPALAISNTETASISTSTAKITWQTNKSADSQVEYGITSAYGLFSSIVTTSLTHLVTLGNLSSNTKYYYRAVSKVSGEIAYSPAQTFTTLAYTSPASSSSTATAPPIVASSTPVQTVITASTTAPSLTTPVSNVPVTVIPSTPQPGGLPVAPTRPLLVRVKGGDGQVVFTWKKDRGAKNGTINTLIVKKEGTSYVDSRVDGTIIYDGPSTNFIDTAVENGKEYHYALYSYGMYGRFTAPARFKITPQTGKETATPSGIQEATTLVFTRDLFQGRRGDDVTSLQNYLAQEGYYPERLITGYFGVLTKKAVLRYQKLNGILPMTGYVGPVTRESLGR